MKHSLKLLLATAVAATTPMLTTSPASADGGDTWWEDDRGPRFVDVKPYIHENGDLHIRFEAENVGRNRVELQASANLVAVFRCVNKSGHLVGGPNNRLVVRDSLYDAQTFKASRDGRIHGELSLDYGQIHIQDFCRGNSRPVLVRLTFDDVRITDLTHNTYKSCDRVSRTYREDDDSWYDDQDNHTDDDGGFIRLIVP